MAESIEGSVLELASGTGRLTQNIIRLAWITQARVKSAVYRSCKKKFAIMEFCEGDMRAFDLRKKFDFIFIGFNSFLHNLTIKDAQNCLDSVNAHLSDRGYFLLSILFLIQYFCIEKKIDSILLQVT